VELCQLCTDASGLIEFEPSSIAPINGSKGSGTCKLSACSRPACPTSPLGLVLLDVCATKGGSINFRKAAIDFEGRVSSEFQPKTPILQPTTSAHYFDSQLQHSTSTQHPIVKTLQKFASCLNRSFSPYWHWQPSVQPTLRSPRFLRTLLRPALRECVQTTSTAADRHTAAATQPVTASQHRRSRIQAVRQQQSHHQPPRLHQSRPPAS
jgi:hypothetical protein